MVAKHFDTGKPDLTLLPRKAIEGIAQVFMYGAKKYGDPYNYRAGMEWRKLAASTLRHINSWVDNEDIDPESGHAHLLHALADLLMLQTIIAEGKGKDDRYKGETNAETSKSDFACETVSVSLGSRFLENKDGK